MADTLKRELGVEPVLEVGRGGEFTVWVDQTCVAKKTYEGFPDDAECLDAVREALELPA